MGSTYTNATTNKFVRGARVKSFPQNNPAPTPPFRSSMVPIDIAIARIRRHARVRRPAYQVLVSRQFFYLTYPGQSLPPHLWGNHCPFTRVQSLEPGSGIDVDTLAAMRELLSAA